MAVTKAEQLLRLLEDSGLLEPEELEEAGPIFEQGGDAEDFAAGLTEAGLLTDWQAAQLLAGSSDFYLGKYKLMRPLGSGGVFLADHTAMNRQVALKTISRDVSAPGSLEKFVLEARSIASLDHPNIVQAYSFDNEGPRFFLVMEYVEGQDLEQIVRNEKPLDFDEAADYVRQTANGLQHSHDHGIIHSDIKPSNLLVSQNGRVKILNMGLSRLQEPGQVARHEQGDRGTSDSADYQAPEQVLGTMDFNHRADIYSLGCTLYFLLTRQPPFPEGTSHERLAKHQSAQPVSIGEFRPDVPNELVEICEKMMAKKPRDRYQTAAQASEALAIFPPPKRAEKPAAKPAARPAAKPPAPPKRATALAIQDDQETVADRRLAARKSKFLATPQQKIIAGAVAGGAVLVLLAILVSVVLRSPKPDTAKQEASWLATNSPQGQQPAASGGTDKTPGTPGAGGTSPPAIAGEPPLDYGFGRDQNPLGVELGTWYTTGPLPSPNQAEKFFPEEGVDLQANGPDDEPLWKKSPDLYEGIPNMFGETPNSTIYMFRTIEAKKPTTLHAGFGSDDTLDVWLNGKKVLAVNQYRSVDADTERAYLRLNIGTNKLLLKVRNGGGSFGFCFDGHLADARETKPGETSTEIEPPGDSDVATTQPAGPPGADTTSTSGAEKPAPDKPKPAKTEPGPEKTPLSTVGNLATFNLDEKSGKLFDLSGKSHHGTIEGNVAREESGKHRGALRFDGSGGRVLLQNSSEFDFSGSFTWTAWIKTWDDGAIMAFTKKGNDGWTRGGRTMYLRDGRLAFEANGTGWFQTRSTINDDKWHHVAMVVKANTDGDRDDATFYIDGKADGWKKDWDIDKNSAGDFIMKIGYCSDNYWKGKFNGAIDGVSIWNRALDEKEIASTMDAQLNPFEELAATGNLKPYGKAAMPPDLHTLGKLSLTPNSSVDLLLVGGRNALQPPRYLEIAPGPNDKQWIFFLCMPTRGGEPTKTPVAQAVLQGQKLQFQWAKAVPSAKANGLLNCGIDVSVDGRTCFLPLAPPAVVKPVAVNLETGSTKNILPGDSLPPRESLRLEVVRVDGFPEPQFSPGNTVAHNEKTDISFDSETFPKLWLNLAFDVKMRPTLALTVKVDYQTQDPPVFHTFSLAGAEQVRQMYLAQGRQLMMTMQKVPRHDYNKIKHYQNEIKKLEDPMARLARLGEVCKGLKEKPGKVHFRLYTVIDEQHQLLLMQSFPLEEAGGVVEK